MTLGELRAEYASVRIGVKILGEVTQAVRQISRRYDPQIYGGMARWEDAEGDLVQSVVLHLLLEEGQLDYLMAKSVQLVDFQRLLGFQVKRYLARQRRRTVVDNIVDRAKQLLETGFEAVNQGSAVRFRLPGSLAEIREITEDELMSAARSAALIPRGRFSAQERAPTVYTRERLENLLLSVANSLPAAFSLSDLAKILQLVLTDWVASFLYDFEEAYGEASKTLTPEEEAMVEAAAKELLEQSSPDQKLVLRRRLEDRHDQSIADELGISRPTVIARKKEILETLTQALEGIPEHMHLSVIDRIAEQLAVLRPVASIE
jgi:DNA-directed RNA polymerase specialized sigma24 family protein